jgi:SAM-dependent methyltransferase
VADGDADVTGLDALLAAWRADLESWAIPEHITAAVAQSPWVLPRPVFARRADRLSDDPSGPSYQRAWAALDPPGTVLDVGAGAGAACLPLLPRATGLSAVDSDAGMLELLTGRATARIARRPAGGQVPEVATVLGNWPAVAALVPPADVVTCHHVLYNVADLAPFVAALTGRAVVVEMTAEHPLVTLNELWLKFHGLRRPRSPTAADLLRILTAMGLEPGHERWQRPGARDYASFEELTEITRRRLCLPPERTAEVAQALDGARTRDGLGLASAGRDVMTIWWRGRAG